MRIKKVCLFCSPNWNVLPAILVTPRDDGFIVAFKWLTGHFGLYFAKGEGDGL